jgi:hypothetical protein
MDESKAKDHKVDRSGWPSGPWDGEPDRLEWRDEATGLPCVIVRVPHSGHLCGYVGVAESHPFYEVGYDEAYDKSSELGRISVHGGLTYAEKCQGAVCHVPAEGESPNRWWFGFDSAHAGDMSPGYRKIGGIRSKDEYRTVAFVRAECERLAVQLSGLEQLHRQRAMHRALEAATNNEGSST